MILFDIEMICTFILRWLIPALPGIRMRRLESGAVRIFGRNNDCLKYASAYYVVSSVRPKGCNILKLSGP
jgi:hypothetical protein